MSQLRFRLIDNSVDTCRPDEAQRESVGNVRFPSGFEAYKSLRAVESLGHWMRGALHCLAKETAKVRMGRA